MGVGPGRRGRAAGRTRGTLRGIGHRGERTGNLTDPGDRQEGNTAQASGPRGTALDVQESATDLLTRLRSGRQPRERAVVRR